ncbi:MAG: glycoside hydrolase family 125 protein [Prevotella sp.]|nr:glycoside hydrolase family 125 protein [Prevotella sp.]
MLKSKTPKLLAVAALLTAGATTLHAQVNAEVDINNRYTSVVPDNTKVYKSKRPPVEERLFISTAVEKKIKEVQQLLSGNPRLAWMFANCFPNTLESTVHYRVIDGEDDTFVYTGDIPAMWLRDSGAQVWPYVQLANDDPRLKKMLRGVILRQLKCINIDRYANAFNDGPTGAGWQSDATDMQPDVFERKYEIDSLCYPIRLAYWYWQVTGDSSIFGDIWMEAIQNILLTFHEQQRKENRGPYHFFRMTDRTYDTVGWQGYGAPVKPVGLIASVFRPSDDRTSLPFLVPSNFMAVSSLRKAAEILEKVTAKNSSLNDLSARQSPLSMAIDCRTLADEVEQALKQYAVVDHPKYGKIYAFEVDGFGNRLLMDDANVPSLLGMGYLGDVPLDDPIYQNTRRFVWSEDNPWFFRGKAGEGIGGPHIGYDMVWPMSIMMKCFTSQDDDEIRWCMRTLLRTDAGMGFIHESFNKDDATNFTRPWFAWQNTLFGELVLKLIADGKAPLLNNL